MLSNSTTAMEALKTARDPGTIAIIGFVLAIIGTLQSGLFTYSAVEGLGKPDGWIPPPKEWGKPWMFSIATGMDGATWNGSEPLKGAGGPLPHVHLLLDKDPNVLRALVASLTDLTTGSNDRGDYLGTSKNRNFYVGHNRAVALEIYPNNVHKHEGQFATFALLSAKGRGQDPICIVDLGLGRPNAVDDEGSRAFGAMTARSCGAAWYHSGVHRQDANGTTPCFWLGGYGTQGLQVHLPSHTFGQTNLPIEEINKTLEASHDWFCNRPAVLSLWSEMPSQHEVHKLLVTDLEKRAGKTLNETEELHKNQRDLMKPGRPTLSSRDVPDSHVDTVTIAHELEGLSAIELCEDALSMGPDYVNIPEGKFCRMSDKTLWPTCDRQRRVGPRDDCFDVESRQLVLGGKVTRSKPYTKEIKYPLYSI